MHKAKTRTATDQDHGRSSATLGAGEDVDALIDQIAGITLTHLSGMSGRCARDMVVRRNIDAVVDGDQARDQRGVQQDMADHNAASRRSASMADRRAEQDYDRVASVVVPGTPSTAIFSLACSVRPGALSLAWAPNYARPISTAVRAAAEQATQARK